MPLKEGSPKSKRPGASYLSDPKKDGITLQRSIPNAKQEVDKKKTPSHSLELLDMVLHHKQMGNTMPSCLRMFSASAGPDPGGGDIIFEEPLDSH